MDLHVRILNELSWHRSSPSKFRLNPAFDNPANFRIPASCKGFRRSKCKSQYTLAVAAWATNWNTNLCEDQKNVAVVDALLGCLPSHFRVEHQVFWMLCGCWSKFLYPGIGMAIFANENFISPALQPNSERFQQGSRTVPVFRGVHFRVTSPRPQRLKPNRFAVGNVRKTFANKHFTFANSKKYTFARASNMTWTVFTIKTLYKNL